MDIVAWIGEHRMAFVILHAIGFEIGAGAATLSYIFVMRALKDFRITRAESATLAVFSKVIWCALALILASGIMLYLPAAGRLDASTKFHAKLVIVAIVILNGLILHFRIGPHLHEIAFARIGKERAARARFRMLAFACGGVSLVSWYSATILGLYRSLPYATWQILAAYAALAVFTVSGAIGFELLLERLARRSR